MFDSHIHHIDWGLHPTIKIGSLEVEAYGLMITLGLVFGLILLKALSRNREDYFHDDGIIIVVSALLFGTLGAKLPLWIMNWSAIVGPPFSWELFMSGRTVLGGFLGGLAGVMFAKRLLGIKGRHGNKLAAPIALGMVFGRFGCFLRGCCYGLSTNHSIGIDFGDHVLRHPTQLYEVGFHTVALVLLLKLSVHKEEGGVWISRYFTAYLIYRFFSEFIRIHPPIALGLTFYQWICVAGIALISLKEFRFKKAERTAR